MLSLNSLSTTNKRGLLSVFGGFLIQLCTGCYHGTFGNLLPYLSSYVRQVTEYVRNAKELKATHNYEQRENIQYIQCDFRFTAVSFEKSRFLDAIASQELVYESK